MKSDFIRIINLDSYTWLRISLIMCLNDLNEKDRNYITMTNGERFFIDDSEMRRICGIIVLGEDNA